MRKLTLSKEPRSRFCVLESAMAQTCDSSFLATASWMGRTSRHSTEYSVHIQTHNDCSGLKFTHFLVKRGRNIKKHAVVISISLCKVIQIDLIPGKSCISMWIKAGKSKKKYNASKMKANGKL